MKKVLIVVPDLSLPGGVANYYKTLKLDKHKEVSYFNINGGIFKNTVLRLIERNISFLFQLFKFKIVHVNPSFLKKSFLRESGLIAISLLCGKKVIVFIRGWNNDFEKEVQSNRIYNQIFKLIWCKSDLFIVLGSTFKQKVQKLGYAKKVIIETTLSEYQKTEPKSIDDSEEIHLLFISRLVKEKGVYIAIDALKLIQTHHNLSHVNLYIAGDGEIRDDLVKYVKEKNVSNCHILGSVYGKDKETLFNKSHILLFPTYYGEGLPNAILEAMGSGLPIVSRINAGIPDQVEHKINGYLTNSLEPEWYAEAIVSLLNPNTYHTISENNIIKAKNYSKDAVSSRLMDIYKQLLCLK
ncbi:glycosyltransferase family 4 protein [Winogradskyella luteola]|uniref:Glycosyltransferase family 4 protein n=1 Tax=Winogradskyella luteola TaxID=2828330 RepID=A0A9X1F8E2_9FLAO|nr:glycosyltransferase family 4 protein [Winogradskyella luteola]MBV7269247.1 glycosyltransferase family 4 protein [Winogradskyella luteola]